MNNKRVLIITGDPIGVNLAGPAIRAWHMALALTKSGNTVRLMSFTAVEKMTAPFEVILNKVGDNAGFEIQEQWADIIIFQGHAMIVFEALRQSKKILVIDIYDPMHLEQLEQAKDLPKKQWEERVRAETEVLNDQLLRGDFFICASERQKYFWLGQLAALGRLNPSVYERDNTLNSFISVVPFGLSEEEPVHSKDVLQGVVPGIQKDDKVILWSGGLYDWFDPQTLIEAIALLSPKYPQIKLFFQGTKHPNPLVPEMAIVQTSRRLAENLGVLNTNVFFNESWVPFADRSNFLLEASIGVSTHHLHVETAFSFRTRILDYLWARLPMVVTRGDYFADLIESEQLGLVVEDGDIQGLADAIEAILWDDYRTKKYKANIDKIRQKFYWGTVFTPLVEFISSARHAPDILHILEIGGDFKYTGHAYRVPPRFIVIFRAVISTYKTSGLRGLFSKASKRLNRD